MSRDRCLCLIKELQVNAATLPRNQADLVNDGVVKDDLAQPFTFDPSESTILLPETNVLSMISIIADFIQYANWSHAWA